MTVMICSTPTILLNSSFVVVSTRSLDPCLWGESDHLAFGSPASNSIPPAGSVHKSRGDSVVRMWVQLKTWCVSCVCVAKVA